MDTPRIGGAALDMLAGTGAKVEDTKVGTGVVIGEVRLTGLGVGAGVVTLKGVVGEGVVNLTGLGVSGCIGTNPLTTGGRFESGGI